MPPNPRFASPSPLPGPPGTLLVDPEQAEELKRRAVTFPSTTLDHGNLLDLELMLGGWLFPLRGFMNRADHASVLDSMLLADGRFWPLPVTLPVSPETARDLSSGDHLALRDQEGFMLAVLRVEEVFAPDLAIDTTDIAPEEAARTVLDHLREQGYLSRP